MATDNKETVLLEFTVDQGAAERDLVKIEGLILDNKKAQQDLAKAYKAGNITQKEYIQENIRLQQNIKKEQEQKNVLVKTLNTESNSRNAVKLKISQLTREYDNLNRNTATGAKRASELERELSQLNAQITKTSKSAGLFKDQIGNYPQGFQDAAKSINIAGVSVGDIGTKLASFANPATAALGVITALGAAYARSTAGAKDLSFAQNQLSEATTLVVNKFALMVTSAEDGEGAVTTLFNGILKYLDILQNFSPVALLKLAGIDFGDIAEASKRLALFTEQLEDLGRLEEEIRTNASQRLEQNQELLEDIADEQVSINEKVAAANTIEQNLLINKKNILDVLNQELKIVEARAASDKDNEALLDSVIAKRRQISAESASLEKQITRINKMQDDLNRKLQEELQLQRFIAREKNAPVVDLSTKSPGGSDLVRANKGAFGFEDPVLKQSKDRQKQFIAELDTVKLTEAQKQEYYRKSYLIKQQQDQDIYNSSRDLFNGLAGLAAEGSKEQKALALVNIGVNTAEALAGGIAASQDIPYPGNIAAMLSSVAAILANIAAAKQYINGFAEGGYTGSGAKYDVAGVVHKGEYVAPKHIVESPMAQGHLRALERMRTGYADGGFVTNQNTSQANQALIMANALKHLPPPIVGVKEITTLQNRIALKENLATL